MFTHGGQIDLWQRAAYGGGKGGGGSSPAPVAPPPTVLTDPVNGMSFVQNYTLDSFGNPIPQSGQSAEDQLNAEIQQRQATEAATSAANTATANQTAATNESNFQTSKQNAYNVALQQAMQTFTEAGVDPNKYMQSDILPALQYQMGTVQDLDPAPQSAFPTNLGQTILNNVQSGARTTALNSLNQTFTPDYSTNMLPDSTLSNYVGNVVSQQFDPLQAQLLNAQKRGTLSGTGYDAAETALQQKQAAATSQVNTLGQGILASDRSDLDSYISGARTDANNLNLGTTFDPSTYAGTAAGKVQTDLGNFGGALTNAVGDTQFANISDLINAGGAVQGSQNPSATNPVGGGPLTATGGGPLSTAYTPPDVLAQQKRGLGNTGAF